MSLDILWNTKTILQVFGAGEMPVTAGITFNDKLQKEHPAIWNKDEKQYKVSDKVAQGLVRHERREDLKRDAQVKVQQGGRSWLYLKRQI